MPSFKRQKLSGCEEHQNSKDQEEVMEDSTDVDELSDELEGPEEDEGSTGTEDELDGLKKRKSRQTSKRKIRATGSSNFGATLQSLLKTDAPSTLPLSLKPSITRKHNDEKLELRAKKVLQVEKKEKEDRGRITDVIGGWGGEGERALRKVAQRGVVKLFNVIQQSQASASAAAEETKAGRGSGKPTLPAPTIESKGKGKGKNKDNIVGRAKESIVDKDDFFNMIRSGGVVSKV